MTDEIEVRRPNIGQYRHYEKPAEVLSGVAASDDQKFSTAEFVELVKVVVAHTNIISEVRPRYTDYGSDLNDAYETALGEQS